MRYKADLQITPFKKILFLFHHPFWPMLLINIIFNVSYIEQREQKIYLQLFKTLGLYRHLRAIRVLMMFKDVSLRARRVLFLYKVISNCALLVLNGTSLNIIYTLLALS